MPSNLFTITEWRNQKMKKTIIASVLFFNFFCAGAQEDKTRTEINTLEQKSRRAIVEKDTATLHKLWSRTFMVNAPNNRVIIGGQVEIVTGGQLSYSSYKGEMEQILVTGDIAITMGHESVVPSAGSPKGGQTIERRYTHIWKRQGDSWLLIARHSSEVCRP
jgi:ketosteroid isomerase-like protein